LFVHRSNGDYINDVKQHISTGINEPMIMIMNWWWWWWWWCATELNTKSRRTIYASLFVKWHQK